MNQPTSTPAARYLSVRTSMSVMEIAAICGSRATLLGDDEGVTQFGHTGAAYCLYLDHLGLGEDREARFWKRQVITALFRSGPSRSPDPEEFLNALDSLTGYFARHHTRGPVPTGRLEAEFERLVDHHTDGLVCRPEADSPTTSTHSPSAVRPIKQRSGSRRLRGPLVRHQRTPTFSGRWSHSSRELSTPWIGIPSPLP
ncbi:hypothetical protein [Streptomyces sp. NPDC001787]|uniref:hypothetical protein n=1 Tax=Streptomyces sp. NPDC001787 TaxID=3154523 RepID=UPI00332407AA